METDPGCGSGCWIRIGPWPPRATQFWSTLPNGSGWTAGISRWRLRNEGWRKCFKIGAKVVRHSRYITFQMAEVAIPRRLFAEILRLIDGLRPAPLPP